MLDLAAEAKKNFDEFARNPYHGRFIFIGVTADGERVIQMLGIEGRSTTSRNRVVMTDGKERAWTDVVDMNIIKDPETELENIIYDAMDDDGNVFAVTNGKQTKAIVEGMAGNTLEQVLINWEYERDSSRTPRISAVFNGSYTDSPTFEFSTLRKSRLDEEDCERVYWQRNIIKPGYGLYLRTYECDGEVLPTYYGQPEILPIDGSPEEILETYWGAMNPDNKVSLILKVIDIRRAIPSILVKNKYTKVEPVVVS